MKFTSKILVVANGIFSLKGKIAELFKSDSMIICCDGAVEKLVEGGYKPNLIIGDLDSISSKYKREYKDILIHIDDQDNNDLDKTLSWLEDKGIEAVTIVGADGARDDHTLGNILLLLENKFSFELDMRTRAGIFTVMNTSLIGRDGNASYTKTFESRENQSVSIFCTDRDAILSSNGLMYELDGFQFKKLHSASLNKAESNKFSITCNKNDTLILVYREN